MQNFWLFISFFKKGRNNATCINAICKSSVVFLSCIAFCVLLLETKSWYMGKYLCRELYASVICNCVFLFSESDDCYEKLKMYLISKTCDAIKTEALLPLHPVYTKCQSSVVLVYESLPFKKDSSLFGIYCLVFALLQTSKPSFGLPIYLSVFRSLSSSGALNPSVVGRF